MKKALIVVSFGTSYPETRQKTIEAVENKMGEHFKEYDVYRAFTSNMVIKKIKQQEGLVVPTVNQLMKQLKQAGYEEVYMQPLHIINGSEYFKAVEQAKRYEKDFNVIQIGKPLLTSFEDYLGVVDWLKELKQDKQPGEAIVLMGHGTQHSAFTAYACLDHLVLDEPIYVCAVESYPGIGRIMDRLKQDKIEKVWLYPLMLVAGDHATNDMASNEPDSWKSQLQQEGFEVTPVLQGMGEFTSIQQMFLEHAEQAIERGN